MGTACTINNKKSDKKKKPDDENGNNTSLNEYKPKKDKWNMTDAKFFFESFIDLITYTDEENYRYIINSSYLQSLRDYSSSKSSKNPPDTIKNKELLTLNCNMINPLINLKSITLVIDEILKHILKCARIDYVIRIPFTSIDDVIRLKDATIHKEEDYLSKKLSKSIREKHNAEDNVKQCLIQLNDKFTVDFCEFEAGVDKNNNSFSKKENGFENGGSEIKPVKSVREKKRKEAEEKEKRDKEINENNENESYKKKKVESDELSKKEKDVIGKMIRNENVYDYEDDDMRSRRETITKLINNDNVSETRKMKLKRVKSKILKDKVLVYLDKYEKFPVSSIGLENPNVYCFMNSCLQCLMSIPEFNYYFVKKVYKTEKKSKKSNDACDAMYEFITTYNNCTKSSMLATQTMYDVCHSFLPKRQQHDSHEYLLKLTSKIQEEINLNKPYTIPDKTSYEDSWKIIKENNHSTIDALFTGLKRSAVICHKCGYQSNNYDPFWCLSLPLSKKFKINIENCLDNYFTEEEIDCDYKCDKCKKTTSITKKTEIVISPPILLVHFLRFSESRQKFNGQISYGETLDLIEYSSQEVHFTDLKYDLIGVVVHIGSSASCGHYVAYCKREGEWFYFNDGNVTKVSTNSALCKDGYYLMYRRIDK